MKNKIRKFKYLQGLALTSLTALLVGMPVLASAQTTQTQSQTQTVRPERDNDITRRELRNFDVFLDNHPAVARELKKNPDLANDANFISKHPQYKEFLDKHPGVREEIKENPQRFIARERHFERSGKDVTRRELKNFDAFLDKHPEIAEEMKKNPNLANSQEYLSKHPEFKEFLAKHPGVRGELKEHPRYFESRERRFEKHELAEHRR